jgi:hypothetical protein
MEIGDTETEELSVVTAAAAFDAVADAIKFSSKYYRKRCSTALLQ